MTIVLLLACAVAEGQPFVPSRDAQCVAFSPTGDRMATGISGMSNGETPLRPHPSPRKCAEIYIFDSDSGERLQRIEWFGDLTRLAFSPDGKLLGGARLYRTVDGLDLNEVQLWDVSTGKSMRTFERAHAFDFSPDGKSIALVSRRSCTLFDLASGERLGRVKPLGGSLAVKFSTGGGRLIGIVKSDEGFQLQSCDVDTGEAVASGIALEEPFYNFAVSADGTHIASGHDEGNVLLWKADTLEPVQRFQSGTEDRQRVLFSPDGKTLACCGQSKADVVFFDVETGREIRRMHHDRGGFSTLIRRDGEETIRPEKDPARFAFSPDGKLFLSGCYGGVLRRMDTGNEVRRLTP